MAMDPSMPPQPDQEAQQPGGASKLVIDIQQGMSQLMQLMSSSQALSPEEKAQFGQIMGAYQKFVEEVLGNAPGAKPQQAPSPKGQVPMEAGAANVQPAM